MLVRFWTGQGPGVTGGFRCFWQVSSGLWQVFLLSRPCFTIRAPVAVLLPGACTRAGGVHAVSFLGQGATACSMRQSTLASVCATVGVIVNVCMSAGADVSVFTLDRITQVPDGV